MRWIQELLHRARALLLRSRVERELDDEIRFHIEREAEENRRRGMDAEAARKAALKDFGSVGRFKEECRDERGTRLLEDLRDDVRYAFRTLRRSPGFAIIAILTLALGIGANTAIFSVVYGVVLRPLPFDHGEDLVVLQQSAPEAGYDDLPVSVKEVREYRAMNRTLTGVVEHHGMNFILLGRGEPERVHTGVVSADFFDVLGVRPLLGRTFRPGDDDLGATPVLVLSHGYWQRAFGGDPEVVGRTFQMNDRSHTVVGVLPPIPQYPMANDVYMPTSACPFRARAERQMEENRSAGRMMTVFGRLESGATLEEARTDVAAIADRFRRDHPDVYPEGSGFQGTVASLQQELTEGARPTLWVLLATAGAVLLLSCANVANLNIARLMRRERELAARATLGASRGRVIRQLATEGTVLSLLGGAAGLVVAVAGLGFLVEYAARFTPRAVGIGIDGWVLAFTVVVSLVAGIGFGVLPILPGRRDLASALKEGAGRSTATRGRRRMRSGLIVAQVAVAFVLLIGAGLMVRSLVKLQGTDMGFEAEQVLTAAVSLDWSKYSSVQGNLTQQEARRLSLEFWRTLLERLDGHPAVVSAAVGSQYPLSRSDPFRSEIEVEGRAYEREEARPEVDLRYASPGYFRTLGIPLVRGRVFDASDHGDATPVAVVNRSMASHLWPEVNPVGRRISLDEGDTWVRIVGVVGDVRSYGVEKRPMDALYRPTEQAGSPFRVMVRTRSDPASLVGDLKDVVYSVDADQAVYEIATLEEVVDEAIASPRLTTTLVGMFAALALLITVTGIGGVVAFTVSQRTREMGIRMALGGKRGSVLWLVIRQGMAVVAAGLGVGVAGALLLNRMLSGFLYGVEPTDPLTYAAVVLVLLVASVTACYLPARRATAVDPVTALDAG